MKAILFIPTGVESLPRDKEYFLDEYGSCVKARGDWQTSKMPILTRHEIDIPEGADSISIFENQAKPLEVCPKTFLCRIDVPRPKKCIKKWHWSFVTYGALQVVTKNHFSKEEFESWRDKTGAYCQYVAPVLGSEIEVEE